MWWYWKQRKNVKKEGVAWQCQLFLKLNERVFKFHCASQFSSMISHNLINTRVFILPLPQNCPTFPSLSRLVTTSLFCIYRSVSFFATFTSLLYFLDSTYKWQHTVYVFLWIFSVSIKPSKSSMLLQMAKSHSFLWLSSIPSSLFIWWWTLRPLPNLGNCK